MALLSTECRSSKNSGVLSGNGLDPRQPSASAPTCRSRHQTEALTVSRRFRPGKYTASSGVSEPGTPRRPCSSAGRRHRESALRARRAFPVADPNFGEERCERRQFHLLPPQSAANVERINARIIPQQFDGKDRAIESAADEDGHFGC